MPGSISMETAVLTNQDIPLVTQSLWGTQMSSIFHTRSQRALLVTKHPAQVGLQTGRGTRVLPGSISAEEFRAEGGAHSQSIFGVEGPRKEQEGPQAPREATEGCWIHGSEFRLCCWGLAWNRCVFLEPHCERLGRLSLSLLESGKNTKFPDTREQKDILCPRVE